MDHMMRATERTGASDVWLKADVLKKVERSEKDDETDEPIEEADDAQL
jgi:hypothetical protein